MFLTFKLKLSFDVDIWTSLGSVSATFFKIWAHFFQSSGHKHWQKSQQGLFKNATGWPDLALFCQLGYFWRLIFIFWKDEVAPNNGDILGYFLFKKIDYIFT